MKDLNEATEKMCELRGSLLALDAIMVSLLQVLPLDALQPLQAEFDKLAEAVQTKLLNANTSDIVVATFEHDAQRLSTILRSSLAIQGRAL